jgi:predicted DNA-binding protein YlxM (UPF0122 family)
VNRKVPSDAFTYYFGLGPTRSYQAVAEHYEVSKRAITDVAQREDWQQRLSDAERKARERVDEKVVETIETMNERHLKVLRFIQGRAIEALKSMSLDSAMDAVRAFSIALDKERTIRGEPADRSAVSIEEIIKREYQTLLVTEEQAEANWDRYEVEQKAREVQLRARREIVNAADDADAG